MLIRPLLPRRRSVDLRLERDESGRGLFPAGSETNTPSFVSISILESWFVSADEGATMNASRLEHARLTDTSMDG